MVGFPSGSDSKESACNAGELGSIPGLGRSPGEGSGYPLQYFCLESSMDRGAWWVTVQGFQRVGHNWVINTHTQFSSVQLLSRVRLFVTLWITAHQASLSITISRSSLKLTSIELAMPSSHLIFCHPLLLLPPHPSQHHSLFQWVNSSHEVAKVLEFQL